MLMGHALIFTLAMALTGSIAADSACKGLEESDCKSKDICTWVSGYEQKDGDKVKAYCRAKPGHGDGEKKGKKKKDKSDEAVKSDDKEEKKEKKEKKSKKKKEKKEDKDDAKEDKKAEKKEKKSKKKKKKDE